MPTTRVAKISGAMIDLIRRRKIVLSGVNARAKSGESHPKPRPIPIPMNIHWVREGFGNFMNAPGALRRARSSDAPSERQRSDGNSNLFRTESAGAGFSSAQLCHDA